MTQKTLIKRLAVLAGIASISIAAHAAKTELTVYTAIEAEDLKKYAARFNAEYPDIKINWVRDSTGIVTAKLLAEKNNPQADVVWGLAATSLMLLKNEGMLESYKPDGYEQLSPKFKDTDSAPVWTGMDWYGRLDRCSVLQHSRSRKIRFTKTYFMGGLNQAYL